MKLQILAAAALALLSAVPGVVSEVSYIIICSIVRLMNVFGVRVVVASDFVLMQESMFNIFTHII